MDTLGPKWLTGEEGVARLRRLDSIDRRHDFLALSWADQKTHDLRKTLDTDTADVDLTANCIQPGHTDTDASMVIYKNGVWCFGCKTRWWPDQFLRTLGDLPLVFERGSHKLPPPKFIPLAQVETYRRWLWDKDGHYAHRQCWLLDRGLSRSTCVTNLIGHTGEAFTIPIFDTGGDVVAIRYRRDDELAHGDRPKYWGMGGANGVHIYYPVQPLGASFGSSSALVLCEGELDALLAAQLGFRAASLTNGCNAIGPEQADELARWAPRITVAYDRDAPGVAAACTVRALLRQRGVDVSVAAWHADYKDLTVLHQKCGAQATVSVLEATWRFA